MNKIQESLFKTMQIFSEYAAAHSNATLTIKCAIVGIKNIEKGEYFIEYLGNKIPAHSNSKTAVYEVGDLVYVLIPDGDFSNNKLIIGFVNPKE